MCLPATARLLGAALALVSALTGAAPRAQANDVDTRIHKKLIESGWDLPDTAWLRQNLAEMEKQPFDGITLIAVGRMNATNTIALARAFSNQQWERKWFRACLEDLRACKFTRFTDNFLLIGANPGNVDWFDDEGWRNIAEHWRIAAWLAKAGGLKGLLFDGEPYEGPNQFLYRNANNAQPQHDKHTFDEYRAKARERGRQVLKAVQREYPDITIFCYFMNCYNASAAGQDGRMASLAGKPYGLYPAFIDGWLDAASPSMTFVDGCESGYLFNSPEAYLEQSLRVKNVCQQLVAPENRAKYRAQVQVGFPIYLNVYANPPGSTYSVDMQGMLPVERLRRNLGTALRVSDEYVWVYNEVHYWWPLSGREPMAYAMKPPLWPEALPGCDRAFRLACAKACSLDQYARGRLSEDKLVNLARNGDFESDTVTSTNDVAASDWKQGGAPAGWGTWQTETSKGVFTWDRNTGRSGKGSARASQVLTGCFIQTYKVSPGECYALQAARRLQGQGEAVITVRWQTPSGKWIAEDQDQRILTTRPQTEWADLFAAVEVPEGVGIMVLLLGVEGQTSPEDVAWYDDAKVYRLD